MTKLMTLAKAWNEAIKTIEDTGIFDDFDAKEIETVDNLRTAIADLLEDEGINTELLEIY